MEVHKSINEKGFARSLSEADILLSIHGREIVGGKMLEMPRFGAVNIHPYLYRYKGANPVAQALKDRNFNASVGAHVMEPDVDEGEVLGEEFVDVTKAKSVEEIYNMLYPSYCRLVLDVLDRIMEGKSARRCHELR